VLKSPAIIHEIYPGRYDLVSLLEKDPERYPYLLETTAVSTESRTGNFDILFAFPQQRLIKHYDNTVTFDDELCPGKQFLAELDHVWEKVGVDSELKSSKRFPSIPFYGGWFLYLGYELVNEIEPSVNINQPDTVLPLAFATRIPATIVYEYAQDQTHVIVENRYQHLLEDMRSALKQTNQSFITTDKILVNSINEETPSVYTNSIEKILKFIHDGDVFQVNLSRQWEAELNESATDVELYRKLRAANPAPFSALVKFDESSIVSSSPERLFCTHNKKIETRPIAGTRPRGLTEDNDAELQSELISNFKERAEHIMLIDLERNDLGRICKPGTIQVDEFMALESYAHVHHIVSNVSGEMQDDITPGQIIKAIFPGGTITGCPKVRCMEIIKELEQTARGAYTGSLGFLNHNGDMDLNILIRSLTVKDKHVTFRAGAGIVADSIADKELEETRAKAKGMIVALQGSNR